MGQGGHAPPLRASPISPRLQGSRGKGVHPSTLSRQPVASLCPTEAIPKKAPGPTRWTSSWSAPGWGPCGPPPCGTSAPCAPLYPLLPREGGGWGAAGGGHRGVGEIESGILWREVAGLSLIGVWEGRGLRGRGGCPGVVPISHEGQWTVLSNYVGKVVTNTLESCGGEF